jgi:probable phosphoglycerate mutase
MRSVNVYLVRHGETEENKMGIIQGQQNTQLNKAGHDQARILAKALKDVPISHAFASDLSRAADVSRIFLATEKTSRAYHPRHHMCS